MSPLRTRKDICTQPATLPTFGQITTAFCDFILPPFLLQYLLDHFNLTVITDIWRRNVAYVVWLYIGKCLETDSAVRLHNYPLLGGLITAVCAGRSKMTESTAGFRTINASLPIPFTIWGMMMSESLRKSTHPVETTERESVCQNTIAGEHWFDGTA